ncbi:MAG: hypothetical protein ABSD49_08770 [Candidatus Bathyarchaeia archaeon]|jgi:hypothetical protein
MISDWAAGELHAMQPTTLPTVSVVVSTYSTLMADQVLHYIEFGAPEAT